MGKGRMTEAMKVSMACQLKTKIDTVREAIRDSRVVGIESDSKMLLQKFDETLGESYHMVLKKSDFRGMQKLNHDIDDFWEIFEVYLKKNEELNIRAIIREEALQKSREIEYEKHGAHVVTHVEHTVFGAD